MTRRGRECLFGPMGNPLSTPTGTQGNPTIKETKTVACLELQPTGKASGTIVCVIAQFTTQSVKRIWRLFERETSDAWKWENGQIIQGCKNLQSDLPELLCPSFR